MEGVVERLRRGGGVLPRGDEAQGEEVMHKIVSDNLAKFNVYVKI